jgi:hypothetical protein
MNDKERQERDKENRQLILRFDLARETLDGAITEAMINEEICKRLQDDTHDEYLVDGALLTCTRAKWGDFILSDGESIKIDRLSDKLKTGIPTGNLYVRENPVFSNGLSHATVADTIQDKNIFPFPCNCMESANPAQEKKIKANKNDCQKRGVCKYLMDLEEEWENINFETPYAKFPDIDASSPNASIGSVNVVESQGRTMSEIKEGITMTSVLFCRHGGFIYPLTSGQRLSELFYKDRHNLTDEELQELGFLFQTGDELTRTKIFNFLFPMLYLDGSSYGETELRRHIDQMNMAEDKIPLAAKKYVDTLNEYGINDNNFTVEQMIEILRWDQQKICKTYDACRELSIDTGIIMSPLLALAVIGAEGTGSYDTNSKVSGKNYNGNGPQHDFDIDTENGLNLIVDKLGSYLIYGDEYRTVAQKAGENKFFLPYICRYTPKLGKNMAGTYATDPAWPDVVEEKYQKYSKEEKNDTRDYIHDYETLLSGYDKDMIENNDTVQYEFVYMGGTVIAEIKTVD